MGYNQFGDKYGFIVMDEVAIETQIQNSAAGDFYDGSAADTVDAIWLASVEELLTWCNSGNSVEQLREGSVDLNSSLCRVIASDLARACGAYQSGGYAEYYLRSAGHTNDYVAYVASYGRAIYAGGDYSSMFFSFCPVFKIEITWTWN